jgi:hypothetical protein
MARTTLSERVAIACSGFLLAVLWFDLMFDVQMLGHASGPAPRAVIDSIAGYYARVTTAAAPMGQVVGGVMLLLWISVARQLRRPAAALGLRIAIGVCAFFPTALALLRIVPNAVALGRQSGTREEQSELARSIFHEHVLCLIMIVVLLVCEIALGRTKASEPQPGVVP